MLGHTTVRQMALALHVASSTVQRDIQAIRQEWYEARQEAADLLISEDIARLVAAEKAIWPAVLRGDVLAVDRLLRIMERRAKLLGLDAPKKVDITQRIREVARSYGM